MSLGDGGRSGGGSARGSAPSRGASRGRPLGRRAAATEKDFMRLNDFVPYSPEQPARFTKKAPYDDRRETLVSLRSNFVELVKMPNFRVLHYNVSFVPSVEDTRERKEVVRRLPGNTLPYYIFDGS